MTYIPAIDANRAVNHGTATYNAVKIQVNDPKTCIPETQNGISQGNGIYNGVSIEVNRPSVESCTHHKCCYEYPNADCLITSDMAPIHPINIPELPIFPIAYQATNYIQSETLFNTNNDINENVNSEDSETIIDKTEPNTGLIITEEIITVPAPNVTTTEDQKTEVTEPSFQGINFKATSAKQPIEIVPPVEIKPDVNITNVISNLSSEDFDVQAQQMEEIAKVSMEDPQKAVPYIVTEIFTELTNIVKKDTSSLVPPSEKQIEIRKQIIVNEIVKEQNKQENTTSKELPYKLSEAEIKEATRLSSLEQAERNKEYALYTMAILAKVYADEIEKHTGNIVPLTDLPGVSAVVDTLRYNSNSGVKTSAIDALNYLYKPEYKDEITSVLKLAADDKNPYVARNAAVALENLN